jgi:sulfatase maturation enzyme AslB (radical SAM superfamily)
MPGAEDIRGIQVVLTAGCNLQCSYCYQNDKKARRMDWDTLRASLDLLLGSRQPEVRLLFLGGEPLLEFPLIRRAVEYVDAARPRRLRVHYDLITNGTLLGEEQAAFLEEHDFEVQLSFDGVAPAQRLRGHSTFAVLDRLLDRLHDERRILFARRLSVAMTLLPETIPHLADSVEYFIRKGVKEISVGPAITHQPGWRDELMEELGRQYARILQVSLRHYRRTGEVPFKLFRKDGHDVTHGPEGSSICSAGRGSEAAIDVDGQVHGCVMFAESYQTFPGAFLRTRLQAMRMGDVRSPDLSRRLTVYPETARAAGIFHDKRDKYSSYQRCGVCRFLESCSVCPVSSGHVPGNSDPNRIPDFQCAYNLVSLEYRARFPRQASAAEILTGRAPVPRGMRALLAASVRRARAASGRRRGGHDRVGGARAAGRPRRRRA